MKHSALLFSILLILAVFTPVMAQPETMVTEPPLIHGVTLEPSLEPVTPETTVPTKEPTSGPEAGWVSITSTPSAAFVELDGKGIGVTPVVGRELGAGTSHTVRVSMEGYEPYSAAIVVKSGEQSAVDATLKPDPVPTKEPTVVPTRQPVGGGKGWIMVSANVDGATVSFNGNSAGCTITSGSCDTQVAVTGTPFRTFTVQKPGYDIYNGVVTSWPAEGQTIQLYATLNPTRSYGSIIVTSYPDGATAYLDGRAGQYTPATFTSVSAGAGHTVQVSMAGYQTFTTTVYVDPAVPARVSASLIPSPREAGSLSVTSNPAGADIYIDGRYRGPTPAVIPGLVPGSHSVRVQKAGYDEFLSTVTVYAGQRTQVPVTFSPAPGNVGAIEVSSDPAGASLFLDGHYMGQTPAGELFDLTSVTPGLHTVMLTISDYQTYTQTVQVNAGRIVTINARLSPTPPGPVKDTTGQIVVTSSPGGANIFLDNVFRGISPLTLTEIPDGSHTVMVRMDGYTDNAQTITVTGAAVTQVAVALSEIVPTTTKSPVSVVTILLGVFFIGAFAVLRH
jgi:hypothetical protein